MWFKSLCLALIFVATCAVPASASKKVAPGTAMPMGMVMTSPTAFKEFCRRNADECAISSDTEFKLTDTSTKGLASALATTKELVIPQVEQGDLWMVRDKAGPGDCEDFALTLRKLMRAQFPGAKTAFRIATAFTEAGEYHAVLSVETDKGTLICDIRYPTCQDWADMPYTWKFRETAGARVWQRIAAPQSNS